MRKSLIVPAVFTLIFIPSILSFAQCTDSDNDGYYYEDGCGTDRDCNDAEAAIYPGATEICNGYDDDCDGSIDEGCDASCEEPADPGSDLRVTYNNQSTYYPSMVWTGSMYGISWWDTRDSDYEIYYAAVDSSGQKMDPPGDVRITYASSYSEYPSLIWTGKEYGVAWQDMRNTVPWEYEIYFARFDVDGNKVGSDVRVTFANSSRSYRPSLAWTGNEYGIAWYDNRDGNYEIYFARLDSLGNKIGSDTRVTWHNSNYSEFPSLVWTGSEYGVAWRDAMSGQIEIYFARIDSSGNKIDPPGDVRVTYDFGYTDTLPSLVWSGSEYGVAYVKYLPGNNTEIYFARIDSLGSILGSDVRITNDGTVSTEPSLASTGSEYGVTWHDYRDGTYEIYFARIDSSGSKIGSDLRVTEIAANSSYPSLAWNGYEYGVSWDDGRDGSGGIELYFTNILCCNNDADGDLSEACDDCDDTDPDVYPGAVEVCDYKDNNCDGTIDEGYITPGGTTGLFFDDDKQTMSWNVEVDADYYDVVKGNLQALTLSGGNFETSVTSCLEDDLAATLTSDTDAPASPGEGFYYVVRAQTDCRHGTYNTGLSGQVEDRDTEIDASSNTCP